MTIKATEHFRMPNNISDVRLVESWVKNGLQNEKIYRETRKDHHQVCTACELCVKRCPVGNLALEEGQIIQKGQCTICYRCVNLCPEKAISILSKKRPRKQFRG